MILCCKLLSVKDKLAVEVSAGIFASPTAVFSFVVCDSYGFGANEAGFDAVVGLVTGAMVIPIV